MDHHLSYVSDYNKYRMLESSLEEILSFIKPVKEDRLKRENTINELASLLWSIESLRGATVKPFGSFVSNIYTKSGDLDISIELPTYGPTDKNRKRNLLRDIMKALKRTGVGRSFQYIPQARVPLLKFESSYQSISCDISIENNVGHLKSKFLLWISEMEGRFRDLILLIKEWAKAHDINDPKSGTLNSYSLCLMVIFHLQTCQPAILPPLKEICRYTNLCEVIGRAITIERYLQDTCAAAMSTFKSLNKSSLSELLISFFEKFSRIESLSSRYAICTYTGCWEDIRSKPHWIEKSYKLIVEDPFEQPENAARAVGPRELITISNAFALTYQKLRSNSVLSDRVSLLSCLVRPSIGLYLPTPTRTQEQHSSNHRVHRINDLRVQVGTVHLPTPTRTQEQYNSNHRVHRINGLRVGTVDKGGYPVNDHVENVVRLSVNRPSTSSTSHQRRGAISLQSRNMWIPKGTDI